MSINQTVGYEVQCDLCAAKANPAFTVDEAKAKASGDGFIVVTEKYLCPMCIEAIRVALG